MKGPAGFGRYDDDPGYVGCPWAKSDMSPCIARDGHLALSSGSSQACVCCGHTPRHQVQDLATAYEPARRQQTDIPAADLADRFAELVRAATEPPGTVTERERLGRLVREAWVSWAREQPDPKPHWLTGWDDLDDAQREADMRIGEAVAAAVRAGP